MTSSVVQRMADDALRRAIEHLSLLDSMDGRRDELELLAGHGGGVGHVIAVQAILIENLAERIALLEAHNEDHPPGRTYGDLQREAHRFWRRPRAGEG